MAWKARGPHFEGTQRQSAGDGGGYGHGAEQPPGSQVAA
eukprot:CAMPEP_0206035268 /NCGR_PEP_ID=MMETSP1466-20131121/1959_1 /ASSEMBLY_ACC=CAM_ASM_001126 /TAXON_ID=44452 /ORGANISM="Pavlova gyrans, Strain CCMP608" /LENGTH=38 /DNA_ID= /DNA_START= /DNA_END= /DNA_ORIENTATION=